MDKSNQDRNNIETLSMIWSNFCTEGHQQNHK